MYTNNFPNCCTATVLADFPFGVNPPSLDRLRDQVKNKLVLLEKDGDAIAVATLCTQQEGARKMLVELGFECAGPFSKRRHPERDLYLLYFELSKLKPVKAVRPRDAQGRFIKANPFK